jgi:hypothetical protein
MLGLTFRFIIIHNEFSSPEATRFGSVFYQQLAETKVGWAYSPTIARAIAFERFGAC